MVAITVVLAAVVYIWVVGFLPTGKQGASMGATYSSASGTYDHRVTIQQSIPSITVKGVKYYIMTGNDIVVENGIVADIYSKDVNGITFTDNDADGKISVNDIFRIKASLAPTGYKLVLKSITPDAIILQVPIL
jgi:FlaG/FlaF family flagellin (archaellin)